jgi:rRNA-processing protein FCF1
VDKRTVAVTLKLTEQDVDLFRKAGETLYGKNHPVPRSTVIRELAKRAAQQIVKKKPRSKT